MLGSQGLLAQGLALCIKLQIGTSGEISNSEELGSGPRGVLGKLEPYILFILSIYPVQERNVVEVYRVLCAEEVVFSLFGSIYFSH